VGNGNELLSSLFQCFTKQPGDTEFSDNIIAERGGQSHGRAGGKPGGDTGNRTGFRGRRRRQNGASAFGHDAGNWEIGAVSIGDADGPLSVRSMEATLLMATKLLIWEQITGCSYIRSRRFRTVGYYSCRRYLLHHRRSRWRQFFRASDCYTYRHNPGFGELDNAIASAAAQ